MAPPGKKKRQQQHPKAVRKDAVSGSEPFPVQGQQSKKNAPVAQHSSNYILPTKLQQMILDVFSRAFTVDQDKHHLAQNIQEVKGYLYNRDFGAAFSKPEYLRAYALRWSAARALGYASIFAQNDKNHWFKQVSVAIPSSTTAAAMATATRNTAHVDADNDAGATTVSAASVMHSPASPTTSAPQSPLLLSETSCSVVCIGGGAGAEVVALASTLLSQSLFALEITAVDIADWSTCLDALVPTLTFSTPASAHASTSTSTSNSLSSAPRITTHPTVHFKHRDILSLDSTAMHSLLVTASLCTLMFTLNELFTSSVSRTTAFLLHLTDAMSPDSHLLVVDSPGSYSEIHLQGAPTKKYPMKWLLDHTLLEVARHDDGRDRWVKEESEDSVWFRIDDTTRRSLSYPLELENMRYQIHSYRRL